MGNLEKDLIEKNKEIDDLNRRIEQMSHENKRMSTFAVPVPTPRNVVKSDWLLVESKIYPAESEDSSTPGMSRKGSTGVYFIKNRHIIL